MKNIKKFNLCKDSMKKGESVLSDIDFGSTIKCMNCNYLDNTSFLQTTLDMIPDIAFIKNVNLEYQVVNKAFKNYFHLEDKDIIGKSDFEFMTYNNAQMCQNIDKLTLENKKRIEFEEMFLIENNVQHYFQTVKDVIYSENKNVVGLFGIAKDITSQIESDIQRDLTNKVLQMVINAVPTQETLKVIISALKKNIKAHDIFYDFKQNQEQTHSLKEKSHKVIQYIIKDKKTQYLGSLYVILDENRVLNSFESKILSSISKLSSIVLKRNVNQELIKKQDAHILRNSRLSSMESIIKSIGHHWRQPLSIICALASGALVQKEYDKLNDEELIKDLRTIINETQNMSALITDFADFFKTENNKKIVTIDNIIHQSIQLSRHNSKDDIEIIIKGSTLKTEIYNHDIVLSLSNIINNSIDALQLCDLNKKMIFITAGLRENEIHFTIQDNAGGIPQEYLHKVFDPYFTTKHEFMNRGLSLYIVLQIVEQHLNGHLTLKNIQYTHENIEYQGLQSEISIPLSS